MGQPADIIITNAKVFTSDETNPHAEAVAVKGNQIVFVEAANMRYVGKTVIQS